MIHFVCEGAHFVCNIRSCHGSHARQAQATGADVLATTDTNRKRRDIKSTTEPPMILLTSTPTAAKTGVPMPGLTGARDGRGAADVNENPDRAVRHLVRHGASACERTVVAAACPDDHRRAPRRHPGHRPGR